MAGAGSGRPQRPPSCCHRKLNSSAACARAGRCRPRRRGRLRCSPSTAAWPCSSMRAAILRAWPGCTRSSRVLVVNSTAAASCPASRSGRGCSARSRPSPRACRGRRTRPSTTRRPAAVVAPHVQQRHLADHGAEQLGPLQHHRAHQQAAVAAALDAQVRRLSVIRWRSGPRPRRRSRRSSSACAPWMAAWCQPGRTRRRRGCWPPRRRRPGCTRRPQRCRVPGLQRLLEAAVAVQQRGVAGHRPWRRARPRSRARVCRPCWWQSAARRACRWRRRRPAGLERARGSSLPVRPAAASRAAGSRPRSAVAFGQRVVGPSRGRAARLTASVPRVRGLHLASRRASRPGRRRATPPAGWPRCPAR
jgi:hypothetical protein